MRSNLEYARRNLPPFLLLRLHSSSSLLPAQRPKAVHSSALFLVYRALGDKRTRAIYQGHLGSRVVTRIGRRDPNCPSGRRLRKVREDTGVHSKGATCVWVVAEGAVGCTRAFLTTCRFFRIQVCRERSEPGLRVNDISRTH
ncbi:uncharacterized protein TNCV_597761 [Trichonephila clavipes]|nr:uncharacterized protein TNCV_597761 [Trichonephila clavipes]